MGRDRHVKPVSFWRTIVVGVAFALALGLPAILLQDEVVTGPLVFPDSDIEAGSVAEVACPFGAKDDWLTCYRAYVPQDHDAADSRTISIFATVIEPVGGAAKDDPFLYLEGGPGYASIYQDAADYGPTGPARAMFAGVLAGGRSVILVDTRGLGFAEPALDCAELDDVQWSELKHHPEDRSTPRETQAMRACFDTLRAAGVTPEDYHTEQLARDLKMLREGLGIDQWNAYGISYGAQSLLALMDVDRAGVRTAVFDSPSYGRLDFLAGDQAAFDRAVGIVADLCAEQGMTMTADGSDNPCAGDMKARLTAVLDKLDREPVTLRSHPFTSPVYLTSSEAISLLHETLYFGEGWRDFTNLLAHLETAKTGYAASLSEENVDWYHALARTKQDEMFSYPVYLVSTCTESDTDTMATASSRWPLVSERDAAFQQAGCEAAGASWDGARYDAADYAGVPTFVISGWRDVITPPSYGEELARDIGGHYLINNEAAHGVVFWTWEQCELSAMAEFLDNPAGGIDVSACLDRCREQAGPARDEDAPGDRFYCRDIDTALMGRLLNDESEG